MTSAVIAFIALGANLDDPIDQIRQGFALLAELPDSRLLACSSLYRTAPVGAGTENHPDYINAVAKLETRLESGVLLKNLQAIETRQGRARRDAVMAPRTLDLDLLLYGDCRIDTAELAVPHPRMSERAFVLVPLAEIAPTLDIPGFGALQQLLPAVAGQAIDRLP
jgi:2-amino-4-hydroxy-6-hydroxymethyldihydropteridine diphosphokinase